MRIGRAITAQGAQLVVEHAPGQLHALAVAAGAELTAAIEDRKSVV